MSASPQTIIDFVCQQRDAVLSTISASHDGYPFASLTPYDITEQLEPVIFDSRISEHYRNLLKDPRASLFVSDGPQFGDAQAGRRATVMGIFSQLPDAERSTAEQSYFERFPASAARGISHDFEFFRLNWQHLRWIGGFGDIRWIDRQRFSETSLDPIAYRSADIIARMNQNEPEALIRCAQAYVSLNPEEHLVKMIAVHKNGFVLAFSDGKSERRAELRFPRSLESIDDVRKAITDLLDRRTKAERS
ncbi:MAG: pyridoxamine 5'-phosphate oxidase family protein [Bdellovibrionota bacterium]